jgi:hypothetical protein
MPVPSGAGVLVSSCHGTSRSRTQQRGDPIKLDIGKWGPIGEHPIDVIGETLRLELGVSTDQLGIIGCSVSGECGDTCAMVRGSR